jgi:hypothetical protein
MMDPRGGEDMPEERASRQSGASSNEKKTRKDKVVAQVKHRRAIAAEMVKSGQLTLSEDDIKVTPYQALMRRSSLGRFGGFGVVTNVVDNDPSDGVVDTDSRDDWFFDMDPTDPIYNVDTRDGKPSDGRL